ncbi:MAG: sialidase family protein [Gammaproteobacteria bacterium]
MSDDSFTIAGWLMRGAIREDDHNELNIGICHIDPPNLKSGDDDPHPSPPDRPIHHFYDPINDEGLFAGLSKKNPDWAIGVADAFAPTLAEDTVRRNHFTVYDAMESMYRALTGRRSADGSTNIGPDNAVPPMTDEEIRKAYWATTFRALGDIVHLIEDVAQPQHTREDPHSGDCWDIANGVVGHASFFERYLEARITQEPNAIDKANETGITVTEYLPLEIGAYPKPAFNRYSDYWSTREGLNGRGMADFSNREFFSAGRNLGDKKVPLIGPYYYSEPGNDPDEFNAFYSWDDDKGGYHTYLEHVVTDKQNPAYTTTSIATKQSIFLDNSETYEIETYTLNQDIYDTQARLLLPRAVAYSAGLIDYFFRGRLKVRAVTEEDVTHLRVVVENASKWPDENSGLSFLTGGVFSFYFTTTDGSRVPLPISQAVYSGGTDPMVNSGVADLQVDMPVQITEPGDATIEFVIDKPGADVSTTDYSHLVVVYKGIIGQEEGIAASVFNSGGLMTFLNDEEAAPDTFTPFLSPDFGLNWRNGTVVADADNPASGHSIFYMTYLGDQQLLGSGIDDAGLPVDYRSDDLGRTWAVMPDTAPAKAPDGEYYVTHNTKAFTGGSRLIKLNVSPGAIKTNGHYGDFTVYHSDDSGLTWSTGSAISGIYLPRGIIYLGHTGNTLAVPTPEGETQEKAYAFIGVYEDTTAGDFKIGVFRSDNGGVTWPRVNTVAFDGSVTRLDPSNHEKVNYNLVYLGSDRLLINYVSYDGSGFTNDFYMSGDRGATWTDAGAVPAPIDRPFYADNAPKVTALVYLGNDTVYSQVARELFSQSFHVLYPEFPNYESYLFTVTPAPGLSPGQPVTGQGYATELIPVVGNTSNYYEKELYHPFVFAADNGVIPGLYD